MKSRQKKLVFALVFATSIAVALALPKIIHELEEEEALGEAEFPTALARHVEKLREAVPGLEEEGRGRGAEAEFIKRAYPADTISVAQWAASREAFAATKGRPFP